jgi:hypothetical protein
VAAAIACAALAPPAAAAGEEVRYRTFVSGADGLPAACGDTAAESTPQIARTPGVANALVGVYLDHGGEAAVGIRSPNGGRSWTRTPVPAGSACTGGPPERDFLVNPYVAAGVGGDGWFGNSWAGTSGGLFRFGVLSHRLDAAGWQAAATLDPGLDGQDAAVAADPARRGAARFMWSRIDQVPNPLTYLSVTDTVMTASTTDGGRTFTPPSVADDPPFGELTDNPVLMQLADRSFVGVVRRPLLGDLVTSVVAALTGGNPAFSFRVDALRSRDGVGWQRRNGIARASLFFVLDPEGDASLGSLTDAAAGADGSVAFVDAPPLVDGRGTIVLTRSADGGATWRPSQATVRLTSQPLFPTVAIGPRGELGLLWYDFRNDRPGDSAWTADAWFASSTDGGRSWHETHVDGPMDLRRALPAGTFYDGGALGVQQDLVALPDGFGAIYGVSKPVAVEGLTDVRFARLGSRRLRVRVSTRRLRARRRTTVRVRVTDGAGRPLRGAVVAVGRTRRRTDANGRARIRVRLRRGRTALTVRHEERRARVRLTAR